MFTLRKSWYQAVLLKQRWNYLNQWCAVYQTTGEKIRPICNNQGALTNKCCSAAIQRALSGKNTVNRWPERGLYQCGLPVRIVYKDNFNNFFQMALLSLAYIVTILAQLHFTRNYFFTVIISVVTFLD